MGLFKNTDLLQQAQYHALFMENRGGHLSDVLFHKQPYLKYFMIQQKN